MPSRFIHIVVCISHSFLFWMVVYGMGFLGSWAGKESACNARDPGSIPGKVPWRRDRLPTPVFLGFPGSSDSKEFACNSRDLDSVPGLGRSPGGGHGNTLQCSCLENPMDRGAWQAAVQGVQRVRHDWRDLADMLNLLRNFQTVFQSSCIILHSYGRVSDQFLCILTNAWCHFLFHPLWYEWCVVISDFVPEAELRIKRSRKGRGADFTQDMWNV